MSATPSHRIFDSLCVHSGVPIPEKEHRFHPTRRWRFDLAWPAHRVALEVEGGVWTGGRHTSGAGFVKDMEKYNAAAGDGWRVLRCQPKDLCKSETALMVKAAIALDPHHEPYTGGPEGPFSK
jgi:very-short-patch-repair endonuclease